MKQLLHTMGCALIAILTFGLPLQAQKITKTYNDVSLSDALRQLNEQSRDYTIHFLYNELEDFRITTTVTRKPLPQAIEQMIGFYPVSMTIVTDDSPGVTGKRRHQIIVECTHKTDRHLMGTVIDEQGEPVAFANVAVLNPADSTLLGGGVTNESGYFAVPYEAKRVLARISYVGYKTVYRLCDKPDLGTIRLQLDQYTLQGVTVKGTKPAMKMIAGGMQIDVQNTLLAQAGNAIDVLAEVPRVNVSASGAVSVFGKGSPEIYINGKKMRDSEQLQQLSSGDIKSIEVITAPGARYNAQVSSVIRITTIKRVGDFLGLFATSRIGYFKDLGGKGGVSLTYRKNGLELNIYPYYSNKVVNENNDFTTTLHLADYDMVTRQQGTFHERIQTFVPQAKVSYDFNADHSIGASLFLNKTLKCNDRNLSSYSVWKDGQPQGVVSQNGPQEYDVNHQNVDAYYLGHMGPWSLQVDGTFTHTRVERNQHITETSTELGDRTINTFSTQNSHLLAGKAVVERKLPKGEISLGTELTHSHVDADNHNPEGYITESENKIKESNYAGFVSLEMPIGHWTLGAGVRYEHVVYDFYSFGTYDPEISRHYDDFFPNINAAWSPGTWSLQLSYGKKTRRPSYGQLRSYQQYDNRYTYEGGNPGLQPNINHELELSAMWKWVSLNVDYLYRKDYILWRNVLYDTHEAAYSSCTNIDHAQELSATLVLQPRFGWYRPQLTIAYWQQFFDARSLGFLTSLRRPELGLNLTNKFVISKTLWLSLQGIVSTAPDYGALQHKASSMVNATVHKGLLDDKLSINLYIKDIFDSQRERWQMRSHEVEVSKDCNNYAHGVELQLTYRFNSTQSKYKGTGAGNSEKNRLLK